MINLEKSFACQKVQLAFGKLRPLVTCVDSMNKGPGELLNYFIW